MHIRNILKSFEKYKCPSIVFFSRTPDMFPTSSYVSNQLDHMMIFYFYLVCFNFSISYSVLPVHLVSVLQFLHLFSLSLFFFFLMFFLKHLSSVVEKLLYTYIWASLVAQLAKNLPAMQATPVRVLGQEDPLEKG